MGLLCNFVNVLFFPLGLASLILIIIIIIMCVISPDTTTPVGGGRESLYIFITCHQLVLCRRNVKLSSDFRVLTGQTVKLRPDVKVMTGYSAKQ